MGLLGGGFLALEALGEQDEVPLLHIPTVRLAVTPCRPSRQKNYLKAKPRYKKKWLTVNKSWTVCTFSVNSGCCLTRSCNMQDIHNRWIRHDQRYVQLRTELDPNDARKIIVHTPNIPNRKGYHAAWSIHDLYLQQSWRLLRI